MRTLLLLVVATVLLALVGCRQQARPTSGDPLVGTWRPKATADLQRPPNLMTTITVAQKDGGYTLLRKDTQATYSGQKRGASAVFGEPAGVMIELQPDPSNNARLIGRFTPPGGTAITVEYERE